MIVYNDTRCADVFAVKIHNKVVGECYVMI